MGICNSQVRLSKPSPLQCTPPTRNVLERDKGGHLCDYPMLSIFFFLKSAVIKSKAHHMKTAVPTPSGTRFAASQARSLEETRVTWLATPTTALTRTLHC